MTVNIVLKGHMIGPIWNGEICQVRLVADLKATRRQLGRKASMNELVQAVLQKEGGDFTYCQLSRDSFVEVSLRRQKRLVSHETVRCWSIKRFKSARHLISRRNSRATD